MQPSVNEQIAENLKKTKADGRKRTLKIPTQQFAAENPQAVSDPRFAFQGKMMTIDFVKHEEISVRELRELCAANPTHPLSANFRMAVMGLGPEMPVVVQKQDLLSIRGETSPVIVESVATNLPTDHE